MLNRQIAKWDRRYAEGEPTPLAPPSAPLPDAVAGVTPGRALDLACGPGRQAVWLATRGWQVDAVDGARAAIARLMHHAERAGCRDRVIPTRADLEADPPEFTIVDGRYDLIVDCYFLHRPLFAAIRTGVRRSGLFVAVLHLPSPAASPSSRDRGHRYVLAPGELEQMVIGWGWEIVHSRERNGEDVDDGHDLGVAEMVARKV